MSWDITIMDTDSHYFYDVLKDEVTEFSSRILIVRHCFVGSDTIILKGTSLPEYSVIGTRSIVKGILEKRMSLYLYAGSPAVLKKEHVSYLIDSKSRTEQIEKIRRL